jgi:ATP-binding cassette subfamily F protein 3
MLGKLLIRPLNLLLLDEPSNHLDIESSDAFVEALNAFEGAVVLVTHNEMFLHALANRLVIFTSTGIDIFEGTYQEFLEKQGWEDEELISAKQKKSAQLPKKELRKKKSEIVAERSKQLTPINKKINKLEREIEAKEAKMARVNDDLLAASQDQDGLKIATLSKEHAKLESDIEALFDTFADISEQADKIKNKFDRELAGLEGGD